MSQDIGDYLSLRLRPKLNHFFPMQFENLLADDKKKILLEEPLTRSDCAFLRSFYGAALPDQHSFDFTKVEKAEILGCGFILKLLDGEKGSVKFTL